MDAQDEEKDWKEMEDTAMKYICSIAGSDDAQWWYTEINALKGKGKGKGGAFNGACHWCKKTGHKASECIAKTEAFKAKGIGRESPGYKGSKGGGQKGGGFQGKGYGGNTWGQNNWNDNGSKGGGGGKGGGWGQTIGTTGKIIGTMGGKKEAGVEKAEVAREKG